MNVSRQSVRVSPIVLGMASAMMAFAPQQGAAQGYPGYPYTIMAPQPSGHHRVRHPARPRPVLPQAERLRPHTAHNALAARGSSGIVLPTPLPRTQLIPPENNASPAMPASPQAQAPTMLPGLNPIPNLPHGAETFQDRASRCAFQQGLYGVPGGASTQYMAACVQ